MVWPQTSSWTDQLSFYRRDEKERTSERRTLFMTRTEPVYTSSSLSLYWPVSNRYVHLPTCVRGEDLDLLGPRRGKRARPRVQVSDEGVTDLFFHSVESYHSCYYSTARCDFGLGVPQASAWAAQKETRGGPVRQITPRLRCLLSCPSKTRTFCPR